MRKTIFITALALALAVTGMAQTTMSSTTLSEAVAAADNEVVLASVTGISAYTNTVNTMLFVGREAMDVVSLSGTRVTVRRSRAGSQLSAHASGAKVWHGPPRAFSNQDPYGACTAASTGYTPRIVPSTGSIWRCYGSLWTLADNDLQRYEITTVAAPGLLRLIRSEILANYQGSIASGNIVPIRGAVTLATGTTNTGAYIYGVQGKVVTGAATLNQGSTFTAGVFGQLDVSGGTVTAGHVAPIISEMYGLNSGTSTVLTMLYLQHAGGGVANSMISAFGKATYVFDIETNVHTQAGTTGAASTAAGWLKILVDGNVRYINLLSTAP